MSMVVRTNINSMNANRNLSINNSQVAKAIEKLASGYAINRAVDDASGLAITEKMQAQITGLDQGTDNALEGIGLVQTAEGAMSEIHDMLNRIVELSTKSANGTIQDEVDREAVQAEVDVLVDEIDRIAQSTNYNGIDLLNGNLSDGGLVIKTNTYTETITTENTTQLDTDYDITITIPDFEINTGGASRVLNIDTSISTTVGSFIVYGGVQGTDFDYDITTGELTILSSTDMRIEGNNSTITESIVVNSNDGFANLALYNVEIINDSGSAFYTGDNDVYIELEGNNELSSSTTSSSDTRSAGLNVGENGSVIIDGIGTLTANGGYNSAGIGSNYKEYGGNITINGGIIFAEGGYGAAGIGSAQSYGSRSGSIGDITINGGSIIATGGSGAAGIGSGEGSGAGDITINGGNIIAISTEDGAGIGSGSCGSYNVTSSVGDIIITGGVITASSSSGTGIGSGDSGVASNIIIMGGEITAIGHLYGPGIGAGASGTLDTILITGGVVNANGGKNGAGIGSGSGSPDGDALMESIIITGGTVIANGGENSAGIGSGSASIYGGSSTVESIIIAGGTIIANGGENGAGIGTGAGTDSSIGFISKVGNITYDEDNITAISGSSNAENIGEGYLGTIGNITKIPLSSTDDDTNTDVEYETTYTTTTVTRTETEVYEGDGLILHVADQNETYNKIRVYIDPMTGEALKIKPLYVNTQELAGAAINIVKDAINYVSTNRCNVGALQNRLEHTINGNNSTSENMTSAKSRIKDCDMAKEMTEYTKMNVLTQASQAMLAQSNQSTQQVLSLLG